jgi:hypothetical protein
LRIYRLKINYRRIRDPARSAIYQLTSFSTAGPRPPAEEDIRLVVAITTSGVEASGEQIAHTGPPAEAGDEAVYAFLARVVVAGEPASSVFPPGEATEAELER